MQMQAVHTMHARGIVWRDGCCNNVMVETDSSGIPKVTVLDFGACERIPAGKSACLLAYEPLPLGRLCIAHAFTSPYLHSVLRDQRSV